LQQRTKPLPVRFIQPESGDGNARTKAQRPEASNDSGAVQSFIHWVNSLAPTYRSQRPALSAFVPLCEKSDSRFQAKLILPRGEERLVFGHAEWSVRP
jgi:hypothetical protein